MTTLTATFSDGSQITIKNAKAIRSHAWQAIVSKGDGHSYTRTGWAGSEVLAQKAARACGTYTKPQWWDRVRGIGPFRADTVAIEVVGVEK